MKNKKLLLMLLGAAIVLLLIGRIVNYYRYSRFPTVELKENEDKSTPTDNVRDIVQGDSNRNNSDDPVVSRPAVKPARVFKDREVARFTIAAIMGQDPPIIKSKEENNY